MKNHMNIHHPTLIMIRGLPGSGKSYLAAELEKIIGQENVVMPDPDNVDKTNPEYLALSEQLSKEGLDEAIHPFRWSRKRACDAIEAGKIIMWNQPFTNRGIFDRLVAFLQAHAREHGIDLPVLLVEVEIDPSIAKQRITKRKQTGGHGPSDNTLNNRINDYESYADGYRTVKVDGQSDVSKSAAAVMQALQDTKKQP